jgi:ATPase subunit of ABC transporter with duplicated ATPase domains
MVITHDRGFMDQIVTRSLWRYMQFEPEVYSADMRFVVNSTMGMMAREVEQQQLVQMLGFVPPESPAHSLIIQALFENTNSADKDVLKKAIEAMNAPPTPEEQQKQQAMEEMQFRAAQAEVALKEAEAAREAKEIQKLDAEIALTAAKTQHTAVVTDLEDDKVEIQAANAATAASKAITASRTAEVNAEKVKSEKSKS